MRPFLLILCLGCVSAAAQNDYLVTLKGDTLRGNVQIHSYDAMDRASVRIDGRKKVFTATEVRHVYIDSARYVAVQFGNTIQLMRVIRPGYLTLYAYKLPDQNTFDGRLLVKMNGSKLELPNIQFKRILSKFLEDCEPTAQKVNNGDWGRSEIGAIVDDYNECVKKANQKTVVAASSSSPVTEAIYELKLKVGSSSIGAKKDVLDLLSAMDTKARLSEPIPAYLREGLKSYLADKKEFEAELNKLLGLLP